MRLVFVTSSSVSCCFPLVKAGMFRLIPWISRCVSKVKPLTAMIPSPGSRWSSTPQVLTIVLSDARPPYTFETNIMSPFGAITVRNLAVLEAL
uniref:Putative secreted protein n=1 Tax=Ixodes ricinus TaxID=34613 RepID=A0A6B0U2D8_IXORI